MKANGVAQKHVPELDGVRGCAVLMVLVFHYVNGQAAGCAPDSWLSHLTKVTGLSWSGVDLFFVLSGFLIGGILVDYHQSPGFYRTFYVRRAARILPVYGFTLACFYLFRGLIDPERYSWLFDDAIPGASYLTFTQNIAMGIRGRFGSNFLGPTWSLAVEEQFYLFVPILLLLLSVPRFKQIVVLLVIASPFLRLALPGFHSVVNTPFRMDSLLIGVILAMICRSDQAMGMLNRHRQTLWAAFFIMLFGMGTMTIRGAGHFFLDPTALAVFYAVFIAIVVLHQGERVTSVLRTFALTRLGIYSYGIYMYHQMTAGLMHGAIADDRPSITTTVGILVTLASVAATLALAVMTHHTFEAFFIRLGKRWHYDGSGTH